MSPKRARLPRTNTTQSGIENEDERPQTSVLEPKAVEQEQASPVTPSSKKDIDGGDNASEHQSKQEPLTRKNLALFDRMGKKGKKASASAPESTVDSTTTKITSTTTSGFAIQAYKNNILDPRHSKPPTNLKDIQERRARSRETASPPESRFRHYANRVEGAGNESTMVVQVSRHILKEYDDEGYHQSFNRAFTAYPKDVGFNNGLSAPQPDFIEGLEMQEFRPFPVDEHVSGAVLYKDNPNSLTLPHLAGEWKGPDGHIAEATLQSAYDGAALVYARNQALAYLGKPDPPGHAEITTFTTDGTTVNSYAHYATPSEDGTLEYHQYHYASANVKDTHQGHKDGRRGLRNDQDHARDQSYALRDQLKEHWKQRRNGLHPIAEGPPLPTTDGILEEPDAHDYETGYEKPCQPTPATSTSHKMSSSVSSSKPLSSTHDSVLSRDGQK